jgi:prepilin-type N-terminal cleavage/methylation domain-containing protein
MNALPFIASFSPARARRRAGLTLVEMIIAVTIFGLVMTAATRQLIEGVKLSMKTAQALEFESSSRRLLDRLNEDVRSAEIVTVFPGFEDRGAAVGDGGYGNYVVMHQVASSGTVTRTIGYYLQSNGADGTWALYRHDSANAGLVPGELPGLSTSGTHLRLVSTVRVPEAVRLFCAWRNRGFTVRGQFGSPQGAASGRLEYVQCSLTTRS